MGGYRAFPDVVTVEVQVRELLEVDCARGIFRVGFILAMRWYDAHFDSAKYDSRTTRLSDAAITATTQLTIPTQWNLLLFRYKDRQNERVYSRSIPYITFDHVDLGDSPIGIPEDGKFIPCPLVSCPQLI